MTDYYFVDTNIIIGYCNPHDRIHKKCRSFIKSIQPLTKGKAPKYPIFNLFSIQEEYRSKIQEIYDTFIDNAEPFFDSNHLINLNQLLDGWIEERKNRNRYFDDYIFRKLKQGKDEIKITDLIKILQETYSELIECFENLTRYWILRPAFYNYEEILTSDTCIDFKNKVAGIHRHDVNHLALAAYIVHERNKIKTGNTYYFYTSDVGWISKDIESKIGITNLKIIQLDK